MVRAVRSGPAFLNLQLHRSGASRRRGHAQRLHIRGLYRPGVVIDLDASVQAPAGGHVADRNGGERPGIRAIRSKAEIDLRTGDAGRIDYMTGDRGGSNRAVLRAVIDDNGYDAVGRIMVTRLGID